MLRIEHRRPENDVMILDVIGKIAPGAPERTLANAVTSAILKGYRKLVLNLAETTSSDASGISALLGAYLEMRNAGGELKLVNIERRFAQQLKVVSLLAYFDVCESEQDALASLGAAPRASARTPDSPHGQWASEVATSSVYF